MNHNPFLLAAFVAATLSLPVLSGCLLDEPMSHKVEDIQEQDQKQQQPEECPTTLCRVETPADTTLLTPDQKEELVTVIEAADDSAVVTIATLDVDALNDTNTRNDVLKDLQKDLLTDMKIPVDPRQLSEVPIDSLLASVRVNTSPDGTINLQWSGTIANVSVDNLSLNVKGTEFLGGYAVVDGKMFTFQPLGGNKIAIVFDAKLIWMGECPTLPKTARAQLTCL